MPEGPPPPFQCGGIGQPACPPQPARIPTDTGKEPKEEWVYDYADMLTHGQACYDKGRADQAQKE